VFRSLFSVRVELYSVFRSLFSVPSTSALFLDFVNVEVLHCLYPFRKRLNISFLLLLSWIGRCVSCASVVNGTVSYFANLSRETRHV